MRKNLSNIPIVVISYNRLSVLKQSIDSYRMLQDPAIVIHDTGSTFPPLLEYLDELAREGAIVHRNRKGISCWDDLNSVEETVQAWFAKYPSPGFYCVTDPDIMLDQGCDDLFDFYAFMLENESAEVVGPMLRIDDIPAHYPLRDRVITGHTESYWSKPTSTVLWENRPVEYLRTQIDTTFGMYVRNAPFTRYRMGIRTCAPYAARHLDWYINPAEMSEDQKLYLSQASIVSHWGGQWLRDKLYKGVDPPLSHSERASS